MERAGLVLSYRRIGKARSIRTGDLHADSERQPLHNVSETLRKGSVEILNC